MAEFTTDQRKQLVIKKEALPEGWKDAAAQSALNDENALSHHGILGQKWGVRRSEAQLGNSSSKKSEGSEDYQKSKEMLKRGAKNLSTKELKDLTTRLQLEQQYKNLNPSDTKKGLDTVKKITAAGTAITTLYALAKTPLGKDVTSAITSAVKDAGLKRAYKMAMGG